jgi:hypothetical protein
VFRFCLVESMGISGVIWDLISLCSVLTIVHSGVIPPRRALQKRRQLIQLASLQFCLCHCYKKKFILDLLEVY